MLKNKIEKLFYKEKNYSKIKELLKDCSESWSFNILGKISLLEKNPDSAFENFNNAGNIYGCAYSKFLDGDIEEAKILLSLIKDSSPAADWLFSLTGLLCNDFKFTPTYFQIRNFYEQDLEMLLMYKQYKIAEEIIKLNSYLETFNREIYKYSARVLANNKQYEMSKKLLLKSLNISYKDPETHFLLGEIYEKENNRTEAELYYRRAIEVNNEYFPASLKLKDLSN